MEFRITSSGLETGLRGAFDCDSGLGGVTGAIEWLVGEEGGTLAVMGLLLATKSASSPSSLL